MRHLSIAVLSTLSTFSKASTTATTINKKLFSFRSHGVARAIGFQACSGMHSVLFGIPRGGGEATSVDANRQMSSIKTEYVKLSDPAPGSPFHLALPVHDLDIAKEFYGNIMGCDRRTLE
jgi:Predicted dioxygenase of extradiol dioxygenase family